MKKTIIKASSLTTLISLFILVSPWAGNVSAASSYDGYFHHTSTLELQGSSCSKDISTTWMNYLQGANQTSFQASRANGTWGVSELPRYGVDSNGDVTAKAAIVYWNETQHMSADWKWWGYIVAAPITNSVIIQITSCTNGTPTITVSPYGTGYISSNDDAVTSFLYNGGVTEPDPGYAGESINASDPDNVDIDDDELTGSQEVEQSTSDYSKDTDGDGLNDYTESSWNPSRDAIFCGADCAYPNPTQKDLYVEVDWMKDTNNRSLMPTSTQLTLVKDAYSAQGTTAHFDIGQYGGGNELPYYTQDLQFAAGSNTTDFYDYKNGTSTSAANFNSNRYHIWHYMISGYEYTDNPGSSGASYIGDDDSFVSTGRIIDNPGNAYSYTNLDNAVAGTILHELGHTLCLTNSDHAPSSMRSDCIYNGIDAEDGLTSYKSVMNYSYQMSDLIDYSDNNNGFTEDHDDWNAVSKGISDFATSNNEGSPSSGVSRMRVGITSNQAKKLRKLHQLFTHVDKSERSNKRQLFDAKKRSAVKQINLFSV